MKKDQAYELGRIVKTHGLAGEVGVVFEVDGPQDYIVDNVLFVEMKTGLVPYFIKEMQELHGKGIIRFEEVNTFEDAQALLGTKVYVPIENLPEMGGDGFYYHEIIGFGIHDEALGLLGEVDDVYDFKSHAVLSMQYKGKEVLIPMHAEVLLKADKEAKIVYVRLPEGLLEVYLED